MKNVPNVPKLLSTRSDREVFQIFNRLMVRMMAVRPEYGHILGSSQDMRGVATQVLGLDLAVRAEDEDLEAAIVRAVLLDAMNQPDVALMLIDIVDRGTDTMLQSATDAPALAAVLLVCIGLLDINPENTDAGTGLRVKAPNRRMLDPILRNTLAVLEG